MVGIQRLRETSVVLVDATSSGDSLEAELAGLGLLAGRARSNSDAMQRIEACQPDFVLTELRIQHESGLELLDQVSAFHARTKVVIATMYGTIGMARCAIQRGAAGFFAKPVALREIIAGMGEQPQNESASCALNSWLTVDDMRSRYIQEVVSQCGSLARAAKALHVDRRSLRRMMHRLQIRK